jgi:hypothetical protein
MAGHLTREATTMRRTLTAGALLALAAFLLADHGGHLGIEATRTALYGVALGAVLGLVRDGNPAGRGGAYAAGFALSWIGYALRAGVLPDIPLGRAIAAFLVVALVTVIAAATREALPLWAGLLGAGTFAAAYETTFTTTPTAFASESVTAATTVLMAAAVGYLVAVLVRESAPAAAPPAEPAAYAPPATITLPDQRPAPADAPTRTEA